ncbi:hypothetical protein NP493_1014g01001 [Ridgeia piscesae]|uniref:EGF-like domain-containing protein n=1 Tax=Ridgeia piscesae TaxID=27915 RepID=A0AAD9KIU2_RIDPI|nr:hypothetical protein NP493_1014g01001 [Ridgeia piscesae]
MYYYWFWPRVYRPLFWLKSFTTSPADTESQHSVETEEPEKRRRGRCGAWWVQPCCCLWMLLGAALAFGLLGGLVVLPAIVQNPNAWPHFGNSSSDKDVDECVSSPCQNGGNCTDGVNEYTCVCVGGYVGDSCGRNVDECTSSPCQNGGNCSDGVNGYTCVCVDGYTGDECETSKFVLL